MPTIQSGDALLIIDVQNDFLPGGALGVPDGDAVIAPLNRYIARFRAADLPILATRDWHPPNHCSFVERGGPWPPHCVRDTEGAKLSDALMVTVYDPVISKAVTPDKDAYSGFQQTDLHEQLLAAGVGRVFVGGLATDYCVLSSVKDALELGYEAFLLTDAVRAVDVEPGDGERAVEEMTNRGAVSITLDDLV